jgi:hypothetical protein
MAAKHNIQITFSKIFAFMVLAAGTYVSVVLKSESCFVTTIISASAIVANKQYQDRIKIIKDTITGTSEPK